MAQPESAGAGALGQPPGGVGDDPREAARVAALAALHIMDCDPDPRLECYVDAVHAHFSDMAMAAVILIDADRVWGMAGANRGSSWPRVMSLGPLIFTVPHGEFLSIADMSLDPRTSALPSVTGPSRVRAVIEAPLITTVGGHILGCIVLVSQQPRELHANDARFLRNMRDLMMHEIEQRYGKAERELLSASSESRRLENAVFLQGWTVVGEGMLMFRTGGVIEMANEGFVQLTGHDREHAVGQTAWRLLCIDEATFKNMLRVVDKSNTAPVIHDLEVTRADGSRLWVSARVQQMPEDSKGALYFVIFTDISKSKLATLALQQAVDEAQRARLEAEAANKSKSNFLANMSHELRTPLHGVMGCVQVMARSQLTPQQRKLLGTIQKSCSVLGNIISDLLDMNKLSRLQLTIEKVPLDVPTLIEEVVDVSATSAHEKGIDLGVFIPAACLRPVLGDKGRIQRVLMNLVVNAIKFTKSGSVAVRAEVERETDHLIVMRMSVSDTGIGIRESDRDRLFKPFSQIEENSYRQFGGTGLGLALCKELAELMGGTIGVDSEWGRGSTFWFTVAFDRAQVLHHSPTATTTGDGSTTAADGLLAASNTSAGSDSSARRRGLLASVSTASVTPLGGHSEGGGGLEGRHDDEPGLTAGSSLGQRNSLSRATRSAAPAYLRRAMSTAHYQSIAAHTSASSNSNPVLMIGSRLADAVEGLQCVVVHAQENIRRTVISYFAEVDANCYGAADCTAALRVVKEQMGRDTGLPGLHATITVVNLAATRAQGGPTIGTIQEEASADRSALDDISSAESDSETRRDDGLTIDVVLLDESVDTPAARAELLRQLRNTPGLRHVMVVLMSTRPIETVDGQYDAALTKPVTRSSLTEALERVQEGGSQAGDDGEAITVLVCDDEIVNRLMIGEMLATWPRIQAVMTTDGSEALYEFRASLNERAFRMVLMDVQMPTMSGIEACRAIREMEALTANRRAVPIIALTGSTSSSDVSRCLEAGFSAVLHKPFSVEQLTQIIAAHIPSLAIPSTPGPTLSQFGSFSMTHGTLGVPSAGDRQSGSSSPAPHALTAGSAAAPRDARTPVNPLEERDDDPPSEASENSSANSSSASQGVTLGEKGRQRSASSMSFDNTHTSSMGGEGGVGPVFVAIDNIITTMMLGQILTQEMVVHVTIPSSELEQAVKQDASAVFLDGDARNADALITQAMRSFPTSVVVLVAAPGREEAVVAKGLNPIFLRVPYTQTAVQTALISARGRVPLSEESNSSIGQSVSSLGASGLNTSKHGLDLKRVDSGTLRPRKKKAAKDEETPADPVQTLLGSDKRTMTTKLPLLHVLVVDDVNINVMMMLQFLEDAGLTNTATAENGQMAIDAVEASHAAGTPFHIILMDCSMPIVDGYEATARIRQFEQRSQLPPVPIIAVTANNNAADKKKCLDIGMNDYIGKPYFASALYKKIGPWIRPALAKL